MQPGLSICDKNLGEPSKEKCGFFHTLGGGEVEVGVWEVWKKIITFYFIFEGFPYKSKRPKVI